MSHYPISSRTLQLRRADRHDRGSRGHTAGLPRTPGRGGPEPLRVERERRFGPGARPPRHGQLVPRALWAAEWDRREAQCPRLRGRVPTTRAPRRASILPGSRHGAVPLASQGGAGWLVPDLQDRGPAGAPGSWPGRAGRDSIRHRHGGRARGNRPLREGAARDVAVRLLSIRRLLVGGGLACLAAAAAWRFALASRWSQRLPPGWSASQRYVGIETYPDEKTRQLPARDALSEYERAQRLVSEVGRPDPGQVEDPLPNPEIPTG